MRTIDITVSGHKGCASENPSIQCLAEYPYMGNREGTSGRVPPPYLPLQTTILFSRSSGTVEGRKVPLPPALKVNRVSAALHALPGPTIGDTSFNKCVGGPDVISESSNSGPFSLSRHSSSLTKGNVVKSAFYLRLNSGILTSICLTRI